MHLFRDTTVYRRTFDHCNALKHGMLFNLDAVVLADINIDTQNLSVIAEQFKHRSGKDQRAAVGNSSFDD